MTHAPRYPYLDGWRGAAILSVLAGHFLFLKAFDLGPFGVELFFVLSGRLMAEILFEQRYPLPKFFQRRVSRVYPALAAFVIGSTAIFYGAGPDRISLAQAARALTFTYNYFAPYDPAHRIDHLWSLCVEEYAYLTLAVIAFAARRKRFSVPLVLWIITAAGMADGIVSSAVFHQDWPHAYWRTDVHIASITASAAIYLQTRNLRPSGLLSAATPILGLAGLALCATGVPDWISYSAGTLLLAASVNAADYAASGAKRALSFAPLRIMGLGSFSIYLIQQPFYVGAWGHHRVFALASCAAAIGLGLLSYRYFENPVRDWLNGARKPRAPDGPSGATAPTEAGAATSHPVAKSNIAGAV